MNKKVLSAGLCLSLVLGAYNIAHASENENSKEMMTTKEETRSYLFKVTDVNDKEVTLLYDGEMTDLAFEKDLTVDKTLKLDKSLFDKDVKTNDVYMIESSNKVKDLVEGDIKKEDITLSAGYEKPVNMDINDLPKDHSKIGLEVVEVNESSATLIDKENPNSKYMASFDDLRDEDVKVGDVYTLFWDGTVMESNPAQFGKIYRVEKADINQKDEKSEQTKMEFEVVEKSEDGVTLAEVGNKDNLYNISLKDLRDDKPELGDRYMITWNGISMKSYPAQFGEIYDVEKWMKKDSDKASDSKDKEDKTTIDKTKQVEVKKENSNDDKNVLVVDKKDNKEEMDVGKSIQNPQENKQTNVSNPKTGVSSVAPLLGLMAGASALLKKKDQ